VVSEQALSEFFVSEMPMRWLIGSLTEEVTSPHQYRLLTSRQHKPQLQR